jgi:hypothetical protein
VKLDLFDQHCLDFCHSDSANNYDTRRLDSDNLLLIKSLDCPFQYFRDGRPGRSRLNGSKACIDDIQVSKVFLSNKLGYRTYPLVPARHIGYIGFYEFYVAYDSVLSNSS